MKKVLMWLGCLLVAFSCTCNSSSQSAGNEEWGPETVAIDIMEAFYQAVANDDFEAYSGVDYGAGELDCFETPEEWERYNQAERQWKKDNRKKWKAIKEYRRKKIAEGCALVIVDMED